jgi:DNA replication protein DnaC
MNDITSRLSQLKLSGIRKTLESRNEYALKNQLSYIDFIELLVEDEINNRQANSYKKKYYKSKLDRTKDLNSFDFSYQPDLDSKLIKELASCRFIKEKRNIIFMGKPGVGKTHLANSIGLEALKLGYSSLFIHASTMMERLFAGRADGTYNQLIKQYIETQLLIIDEIGFQKIDAENVNDFFEIIRRRYENGSMIITTNRNFEDWGEIFGDVVLASAIIDRILHYAIVIRITGDSYRMKDFLKKRSDNSNNLTKKVN